jgi:hypothetical protein
VCGGEIYGYSLLATNCLILEPLFHYYIFVVVVVVVVVVVDDDDDVVVCLFVFVSFPPSINDYTSSLTQAYLVSLSFSCLRFIVSFFPYFLLDFAPSGPEGDSGGSGNILKCQHGGDPVRIVKCATLRPTVPVVHVRGSPREKNSPRTDPETRRGEKSNIPHKPNLRGIPEMAGALFSYPNSEIWPPLL